jgi:DNA modification methylase
MSSWKDIFPIENRYFETENGILYHGDCYGILKDIDKSQVHLLLTAPPYNITTGGGVGRKRSFLKEITHDKLDKGVAIKRNTKLLHPTIKPLEVITWLLNIGSQENEIVIDIFAGSGTTAIACESLNRKWVCIEKELKYCKIIRERL